MKYAIEKESTLLEALNSFFPKCSKNTLREWLKQERVSLDGKKVKAASHACLPGQEIEISEGKRVLEKGIEILYKDTDIVVINKPEGILTVASKFERQKTIYNLLKQNMRNSKIFVVHRLDQDTSGVMLFALSEKACQELKKTFEKHKIERKYLAIVEGHLETPTGTWRSYLREDANYYVHSSEEEDEESELAVTHYRTLKKNRFYSLLELTLETGKKNQIRVHCKEAGCPIVGDKKYGSVRNPVQRLCLHAFKLSFLHPINKKKMGFESPMPANFSKII